VKDNFPKRLQFGGKELPLYPCHDSIGLAKTEQLQQCD